MQQMAASGKIAASLIVGNYDPLRGCAHTPGHTYTREPCSCGRPLWPPRGRGRGEDLCSPRRVVAKLKAVDALWLRYMEYASYGRIAKLLGYKTPSGAYRAVKRTLANLHAWDAYREQTGTRRRSHAPSDADIQTARARLDAQLAALEQQGMDARQVDAARDRLRHLLVRRFT